STYHSLHDALPILSVWTCNCTLAQKPGTAYGSMISKSPTDSLRTPGETVGIFPDMRSMIEHPEVTKAINTSVTILRKRMGRSLALQGLHRQRIHVVFYDVND